MENEEVIEVKVSVVINGETFEGMCKVNTDTESVTLSEELESRADGWAYYSGSCVERIREILECTALHEADCTENIRQCDYSGYWLKEESVVFTAEGDCCAKGLTVEWNEDYYYEENCETHNIRDRFGDIEEVTAPSWYFEDMYYCDRCGSFVSCDDYYGDNVCTYCHDEEHDSGVIEDYCESHNHSPIFYGEYKGVFSGLGFELEVDGDYEIHRKNQETASNLTHECGLEDKEMRYAYDGSLDYGFEIISQPHTIKDFWDKADKWRSMLKYLSNKGYKSHDAKTCGLHVHVSRTMFGKTPEEQDRAIAKVYTFFDENWSDLVLVSRRSDFDFCKKNSLPSSTEFNSKLVTKYDKWKVGSKSCHATGHHVALNNANLSTFEYRLGRGTLNAWSFFSWIDFVLTITKNAKRITVDKVTSNDKVSWLGGIRESTAKYIYKRGAFRKEMLTLFPNIEWETDLTDNSND